MLSVNKKYAEFSIKRDIAVCNWNNFRCRAKETDQNLILLNTYLDDVYVEVNPIGPMALWKSGKPSIAILSHEHATLVCWEFLTFQFFRPSRHAQKLSRREDHLSFSASAILFEYSISHFFWFHLLLSYRELQYYFMKQTDKNFNYENNYC